MAATRKQVKASKSGSSTARSGATEPLAIDGGPKAFPARTGKAQPKLRVEEFMSIAERFGFKPEALARIREAISNDDFTGGGPNLARYVSPVPELTKGPKFEALGREKFGVKHALGVSSGTGALHSAFVAVGVGPGTEVICPGIGFEATAGAVVLAGGVPVFCDVDESLHIDPRKIEALITPRTVAVAPTHHWGGVADMDGVLAVARRRGLKVVEDCAQSPGARYHGRYVGTMGDVGCFSISAYKIIGGGEGGMVITNDQRLFDRICQCAEFGGLWRPDRFAPPRYEGELFPGANYRLSELEAAVDVVQLARLDDVVAGFRAVSRRVRRQLRTFREIVPQKSNDPDGDIGYVLRFFPATHDLSARICRALAAEGISAATRGRKHKPDGHMWAGMYPIILRTGHIKGGSVFEDPRYIARGGRSEYKPDDCPVARDLFGREVEIWLDQWYSPKDCDRIAHGINKVLSAYATPDPSAARWL